MSDQPIHPPASPRRFSLSLRWTVTLLALVTVTLAWSGLAEDPDLWVPNPWRALVVYMVSVFVVTGWVRQPAWRANLRLGLVVLPVTAVLGMEWWMATRQLDLTDSRLMRSEHPALRYQYRPGATSGDKDATPINPEGLWDDAHPIPKPPGTFRLVLLGDSVPNDGRLRFGQRFHKLLEDRLNEGDGPKVEVVNVSCEGYNTLQEVELYAQVGRKYQPDLVLLSYVVNDPFLQHGGYRRLGNSFFLFQLAPAARALLGMSDCGLFEPMHRGYGFQYAVAEPMRRLQALAKLDHAPVVVAALPLVTDFEDPICAGIYDQIGDLSRSLGFGFERVVDAFEGEDPKAYLKPADPMDKTHPNAAGHQRMADFLARRLRPRVRRAASAASAASAADAASPAGQAPKAQP